MAFNLSYADEGVDVSDASSSFKSAVKSTMTKGSSKDSKKTTEKDTEATTKKQLPTTSISPVSKLMSIINKNGGSPTQNANPATKEPTLADVAPGNPTLNIDSVLEANMSKNFVQRMFEKNPISISSPYEKNSNMTHFMEVSDGMAYPRVIKESSGLKLLNSDDAYNYAKKTGEFIKFNNDNDALFFTQNYKTGKGVTIGK
jgi:hypothetical protein